jgi:hypothetical protein
MKWEHPEVILGGGADGMECVIQTETAIFTYEEQ